ncbi:MAG: ABC transporter substrate-binding protein [Spirochaetia bacterium]|nr:ABC transporter substrate-binding protein [Spirochaetia bacterium]
MKRAVRDIIIISVLLMLALPAFIFAGAEEEAAPTGPIDIVYWRALTGAAGDTQDELVVRFNEAQTRVVAEAQFQGAYAELLQKLLAGLAAGSVPDVVLLDSPFVGLFAKDGALVSLDSFVAADKTDFDLTDYVPGLLQDGYYGKNLYALPFMRSTPLIYYNADMFREVGLPDRAPDTWDELREFSRKLTKVENGETARYGTAFTLSRSSAHWYFQGGVYAYGGQISDDQFGIHLQEAPAMAVAQLWQDMVMKDKIAIGSTDPHTEFLNGRVGIVFGSTGSMGSLMSRATFEVIGAFIPQKVQRLVPVGGSVLAMPSTDKTRQSAAWDFMKYMTNAASNSYVIQKTGYMPVTKSAANYPDTVAYYAQYPERKVAVEQLAYTRPQASVISLGMGTEILRQMLEKLLIGGLPVSQVMAETTAALEKEYNDSYK